MTKRTLPRLRSAVVAGVLVIAPVTAAGQAFAAEPTPTNSIVLIDPTDGSIRAEEVDVTDVTPAGDQIGVIHNPDGEDIMPLDAGLPAVDDVTPDGEGVTLENPGGVDIAPISAELPAAPNPWPGRIGWGLGGLILGGLLGHLFHRRRYVQFESRV